MPEERFLVRLEGGEGILNVLASLRPAAIVKVFRAIEAPLHYAYVEGGAISLMSLRNNLPINAAVDRLQLLMSLPGASAGVDAPYHYVVETDVLAHAEVDFNAWYDREHLPGLAAVPGTVHAARYRNPNEGPRYYACYDLATLDAFGSPPWLAVRATEWSSRVRPSFRNTRRTMFRRVEGAESVGR